MLQKNKQKPIYIIEHLEPELFEWCLIEYEHISETVGKDNLWFCNIKNLDDRKKLERFGKVFSESIRELKIDFLRACVLDPESNVLLSSEDRNLFDYYIFGGILGDYPPKKRTSVELTKFIRSSTRNIGKEQMSTDNAVFTTKEIINGKKFNDLKFVDKVSVEINEFESVDLPYRYNVVDGKPFMSKKIKDYLIKKKGF
jgi:ribosome biogenesis SPOUT family RNA methylase Rps3